MTIEKLQEENQAIKVLIASVRAALCDVHNKTEDAATHVFAHGLIDQIDAGLADGQTQEDD
jgi:hypothetical protein